MPYLALLFVLVLLFINLWGGAVFTAFVVSNRWLAAAITPWIWVTLWFGLETIHGAGPLRWLTVFTTSAAIGIILANADSRIPRSMNTVWQARVTRWRQSCQPRHMLLPAAVFILFFGYAFAWRVAFPMIDGSSEKIPDLAYVCSYLAGDGVPAHDAWLSPYPSTQYYSFQYYAAALMGRMLGLGPGYTYNLAFCVMVGLCGVTFVGATTMVAVKTWVRVALTTIFMVGGTGASGIVHFFYKDTTLWNGMRFIGSQDYDRGPVGLAMQKYSDQFTKIELPGEPLSYMVFLGDYHPPFSGFYTLALGILAGALWERTQLRRYAAIAGATITWTVLSNTWTFPLQFFGMGWWCLWHFREWRRLVVPLSFGCIATWFVCSRYLFLFASASTEYHTAIRLVPWNLLGPPLLILIYLFPTLGATSLVMYSRNKAGLWIGLGAVIALLVSEFVYIDDVYSGSFERFNTTLKWWPWIAMAVLLLAVPVVLERATRRWVRWLGIFVCLYPAVYGVDLAVYWWTAPKLSFGQLHGASFLNEDEGTRFLLARMSVEKPGVVVERPNKDSYTNSACLPLFAGHRLWLGWVGHELLWHGYAGYVQQRQDRLLRFYGGDPADAPTWLVAENIDYILWYQEMDTNEIRVKLDEALRPAFDWCEVFTTPTGKKVGFWRRKVAH